MARKIMIEKYRFLVFSVCLILTVTLTIGCIQGGYAPGPIFPLTVSALYPNNGANWNDYVTWTNKGGTGTVFNQPDLPCAGTELGYYACIHGGEKRVASL